MFSLDVFTQLLIRHNYNKIHIKKVIIEREIIYFMNTIH